MPYRPNANQTKYHPSGRRAIPFGPSTMSRRFYPACIHPDISAARLDASRYSTSLKFFPSFDKRKIVQPSGRCGILPNAPLCKARIAIQISPSGRLSVLVRMRVQLIWNCQFDFNRPDDYLSWSGCAHSRYWNRVLKFNRPDAHPPWSGRAKPYKEITCYWHATIRKMCHPVRMRLLNRKDFSSKFSKNPIAQLSVRTVHVHRLDDARLYFA